MIQSYDVGSLPLTGDEKKFSEGATCYASSPDDSTRYFETMVIKAFIDKAQASISVPNFPQFRGMNEMFLDMISGVEKTKGGYMETGVLFIREEKSRIPEVEAIKKCSTEIYERIGRPFQLKVCVTGPYTLSSLFLYKDSKMFNRLADVISRIVEKSMFSTKHGSVRLICLDEPVFGLLDDPLMDRGSEGRENLRKAWENIFQKANSRGIQTCMHLHNTTDELFWDVKPLNVVESHVDDPLYHIRETKQLLESTDKFLKASICTVDFDKLIKRSSIMGSKQEMSEPAINQRIADTWKEIAAGKLDPETFLEDTNLMKQRLTETVDRFGVERVPYAGPECGLRGFPTYECALECLRRVSSAVKSVTKEY